MVVFHDEPGEEKLSNMGSQVHSNWLIEYRLSSPFEIDECMYYNPSTPQTLKNSLSLGALTCVGSLVCWSSWLLVALSCHALCAEAHTICPLPATVPPPNIAGFCFRAAPEPPRADTEQPRAAPEQPGAAPGQPREAKGSPEYPQGSPAPW